MGSFFLKEESSFDHIEDHYDVEISLPRVLDLNLFRLHDHIWIILNIKLEFK